MADLQVKISASIEGLIKNINTATARLETFSNNAINIGAALTKGLSVPLAAIGTAAFAASVRVGNFSDQILDLEQQTGLTTDAIQKYRAVTIQAGIATDTVATASQNLQRRLASGEEGSKDLTDGLAKLGITARDTAGNLKPIDTIVEQSISRLADFTDITERNQLALKIFGRSAADLAPLLALGSDGIEQAKNRAVELGLVLSKDALEGANEFRIAFDFLKSSIGGITNEIGLAFLPVAQKLVSILQEKIVPIVRSVTGFFNGLSDNTKIVISVIGALVAGIGPLLLSIGAFIKIIPFLVLGLKAIGAAVVFATGPIGLAVAGIAALTAAIVAINKGWRPFKILIEDTEKPINNFTEATKLASEAQDILNKGVGVSIKENPKLIASLREQVLEKINLAKATLEQINAQRLANLAIEEQISLADKLKFITFGGDTPEQRAANRQAEKRNDINADFAKQSEAITQRLNELSIAFFKLGVESKDALDPDNVEEFGNSIETLTEKFNRLAKAQSLLISDQIFEIQIKEESEAFIKKLGDDINTKLDILEAEIASKFQDPIIIEVDVQLGSTPPTIEIPELDQSKKTAFLSSIAEFSLQVEDILRDGIENAIGDFAFSIGEAIGNASNVLRAGAASILGSFSSILNNLGTIALKTGILTLGIGKAVEAIKKALTTLSGPVAIIAGAALIGLAGLARASASRIGGGGSVSGVGSGSGGGSFARGGQGQTFAGSQTSGLFESERFISLALEPVISGDQIRFVLDQSNQRRN
jgi:hypothetical protein